MKKYLQIALNLPLFQTFTYLDIDNPENHTRIGCRADIKFGNRRMIGYVIAESNQLPEDCPVEENKIRPILKIIDKSPTAPKIDSTTPIPPVKTVTVK